MSYNTNFLHDFFLVDPFMVVWCGQMNFGQFFWPIFFRSCYVDVFALNWEYLLILFNLTLMCSEHAFFSLIYSHFSFLACFNFFLLLSDVTSYDMSELWKFLILRNYFIF